MTRPDGERGSASIWVVCCCALLLVVALVSVLRTTAVLARHRAEAVADLAALAAAGQIGVTVGICPAAARVAAASGATVQSCVPALDPGGRSGTVSVRVRLRVQLPMVGVREVVARARAGRLTATA
jgi:secretion/DNA translocation related TadE-like protein